MNTSGNQSTYRARTKFENIFTRSAADGKSSAETKNERILHHSGLFVWGTRSQVLDVCIKNSATLSAKDSSPPRHMSNTQSEKISGCVASWMCFEHVALASSSWASLQPCHCTRLTPACCFFSTYAAPAGLPPKVTHDPVAWKKGFLKIHGMVHPAATRTHTDECTLYIYLYSVLYSSILLTTFMNSWEGKNVREKIGYYFSSVRNPVAISHVQETLSSAEDMLICAFQVQDPQDQSRHFSA